jgi:uncharacterized protein involved in response to NO
MLTAAPHRTMFFAGLLGLVAASGWWALHLWARQFGAPLFALMLHPAPIWAHSFLMLFAVFPTLFFGFLFTVFPRWMNGPAVSRTAYVTTGALFAAGTLAWLTGTFIGKPWLLLGCILTGAGLFTGLAALFRVLLASPQVVSHAVVVLVALSVQSVALAGFAAGVVSGSDFALHFAVRASLWGGLLPVFFAVSHRMIPFFSQNVVPGYQAWRPLWVLVAVVSLAYARLLAGTAGLLGWLPWLDALLVLLTGLCAWRWTSLRARGNALLWSLYVGVWWLPVAMLLQLARDASFVTSGAWALGRAPIHALGMGFFGSLLMAMVTRVTMGHSGRPLRMDTVTLVCFLVADPAGAQAWLMASLLLWLAAIGVWTSRVASIYLAPRIDGKPG